MADPRGPVAYRPAPGEIPESPGVYRFRDQRGRVIYVGKAKSLRQRLNSYFADFASLHPRTQMMLTTAAGRRVDRGRHRGRGAAAGVLLDQGVRPPVQRQVPGRQELPLPGRHDGRGVPAGHGHARRQAQGHQVLRPVQPRLGHPRHGGHAAPGVPGAHLLGGRVQAVRPDRPPLPARLHRQVLRAVRQADQRGGAPPPGRGLLRLHGRADQPVRQPPRGRDEAGRAGGGVRARRPAPRRPAGAGARDREAGGGARRRHRLRRDRAGRGPARGGRPGVLRARRPGPRPARLGPGQGRGSDAGRPGRAVPRPGLRGHARPAPRRSTPASRARSWCPSCRRTRPP